MTDETTDFVITDEMVEAAATRVSSVARIYYGPQIDAPHMARKFAHAALTAALPALRRQIAEEGCAKPDQIRGGPIANREGPNSLDQWLEEVFSTGAEEGLTWAEAAKALFDCGAVRDEAETKALAETATQLGHTLGKAEGRKEAGEEIAQAIEARHDSYAWLPHAAGALNVAAGIARDIGKGDSA